MVSMTRYRWYVGLNINGVPMSPEDAAKRINEASAYLAATWGGVNHHRARGRWESDHEDTEVFEVLTNRVSPHHRLAYAAAADLKTWFDQQAVLWTAEQVEGNFA